jgi:hypothetical protein
MSVGCESTQAGCVPARKPPFSAKMKMPAAQLVLDLPFGLRRFCAASVEMVREHLQHHVSNKTKSESNPYL